MARKMLGIDFGTSSLKIYKKDEGIVLDEKTVIAIADKTELIAGGNEAYEMLSKAPANISVTYPIHNGVVADIENMQKLLDYFLSLVLHKSGRHSHYDYIIAVPTDITEVERKAFYDLVANSKGRPKNITMIEKPIAAALGMGLDIGRAKGVMTVDIGADTTEISIMSLGGIVISTLLSVGGRKMEESIKLKVKKKYNLLIGDRTAEMIKKQLGCAYETEGETLKVYGRNVVSGLPSEMEVDGSMVYAAIREHLSAIVDAIRVILERTPPEISSDIIESGIYLTGGSANIRRLDELIHEETELLVNFDPDSGCCVVKGLGNIIENPLPETLCKAGRQAERRTKPRK